MDLQYKYILIHLPNVMDGPRLLRPPWGLTPYGDVTSSFWQRGCNHCSLHQFTTGMHKILPSQLVLFWLPGADVSHLRSQVFVTCPVWIWSKWFAMGGGTGLPHVLLFKWWMRRRCPFLNGEFLWLPQWRFHSSLCHLQKSEHIFHVVFHQCWL